MSWSRRPPFATDGQQSEANNEGCDDDARLWRQRVAEAAGLAAEDLEQHDHPSLRALHADLKDLEARMTDGFEPVEADDPRRDPVG